MNARTGHHEPSARRIGHPAPHPAGAAGVPYRPAFPPPGPSDEELALVMALLVVCGADIAAKAGELRGRVRSGDTADIAAPGGWLDQVEALAVAVLDSANTLRASKHHRDC